MTGFGRAEGVAKERKVTVEIRSLNSKQLDLQVKLPGTYKEKEVEVRQQVAEHAVRGKVEVHVSTDGHAPVKRTSFDKGLLRAYHEELRSIVDEIAPGSPVDVFAHVLRMPDVMVVASEELDEEEWNSVQGLIGKALKEFDRFRSSEGGRLQDDLRARVERIGTLLTEIEVLDNGRTDRTRERLKAKLAELEVNVDADRFEQELVYYLEKLDINEERVRLRSHCTYFLETMEADDQQVRKLIFIGQEMGREINTLGSKANDAGMQRLVVMMKDELEKVKEQVLNVL